jgi:hypothetical protein
VNPIHAESFRGADRLHGILEQAQAILSDTLAAPPEPFSEVGKRSCGILVL